MARLVIMLIILIVLQGVIFMFTGQNPDTSYSYVGDTTNSTSTNVLWDTVTHPENWNNARLMLLIIGVAIGVGLVGVVLGSYLGFKTDFLIFASSVPAFIAMGFPFVSLYNVMNNEITIRFFSGCGANCGITKVILGMFLGSIFIYYIMCIVDWWRGRDM